MLPSPETVDQLIRQVAKDEILPRFRNLDRQAVWEKNAGDVVTIADERAEAALERGLAALLPGAQVVGEEGAEKDPDRLKALRGTEPVWIIDPVDGTQNFADGKTCFAVIVALAEGGETRAGWIHEPVSGASVWAVSGQGAWEDGKRLHIRPPARLGAYRGSLNRRFRQRLQALANRDTHEIPAETLRYGCVGAEYADLARGKLQFARYAGKLKPWDHAAGVLIHQEAGGFHALVENDRPYSPDRDLRNQALLLAPEQGSWRELRDLFAT